MKKLIAITFISLFNFQPSGFCRNLGYNTDTLELKIDNIVKAYISNDRTGVTIGIIENEVLVFKKGYGMANLEERIPNGSNVSYKIASVSKQFTAAGIIALIQQKKISLNDDIRKYIPEMEYEYKNIFTQLNMSNSGFDGYKISKKIQAALSYKKTGAGYISYNNDNHTFGDGGVTTTLEDLAKWDKLFMIPNL